MEVNISDEQRFSECQQATLIAVVALHVFSLGLLVNIVFVFLVLKKLASWRRNDKIFLVNIVAANIVSFFGSLLGETLGRGKIFPSAQKHFVLYHQASFLSLFNNLVSMAALCYDLYENIVKFPGNRKMSFSLSLKLIVACWILSPVFITLGQVGFIMVGNQGIGNLSAHGSAGRPEMEEKASLFTMVALVTIYISVFCCVIRIYLTGVSFELKKHREETKHTLGKEIKVAKVISFNRQAYVLVFTYSICWIPFGCSAVLTALEVISFHSCTYFACLVGAHVSAAITPLIYLAIDKRFVILKGLCHRLSIICAHTKSKIGNR